LFPQIELGSTNVRVGSTIFGARESPKQKDTQQQNTSEQPSQQAKSEATVLQNNTETSSEKQQENDEVLKQFQSVAL
jgi:hypothetical protein